MEMHKEDNIVSAEKRQEFGINGVSPRNIPFPTTPIFVLVWLLWLNPSPGMTSSLHRLVYTIYHDLTCRSTACSNPRPTDA